MKVLIFSPFGNWPVHGQVDAVTGAALALRRAEVLTLTCDALYTPCAMNRGNYDCPSCIKTGESLFQQFGAKRAAMNDWLTSDDLARADQEVSGITTTELTSLSEVCVGGQPVGQWILPNILTHFRTSPRHLADPAVQHAARGFLRGAYLTHLAIDRVLNTFKADSALLFSGRFYPHRAAFETLRARGVNIVTHERGKVPGSFTLRDNITALSRDLERRTYDSWRDTPMTRSEVTWLRGLFETKRAGKPSHVPSFYKPRPANQHVRELLKIAPEQKIVGVFTSSQDEVSSMMGTEALNSQGELLRNLFTCYAARPVTVVVRHHPHVAGWHHGHQDKAFLETLRAVEAQAPPNFRIVAPDNEAISSYDLFPFVSAAFAPFTSLSNELMAACIPTVVYRGLYGIAAGQITLDGLDIESVHAAAESLDRLPPVLNKEQLRAALRCAYSFYARTAVSMKSFGIKESYKPDIRVHRPEDLAPGKDPELDRLCDRLLGQRPLYRTPGDDTTPRSIAEESEALDRVLRDATVYRGQHAAAHTLGIDRPPHTGKKQTLRDFLETGQPVPFDDALVLINGPTFPLRAGEPISPDAPLQEASRLLFYGDHTRSVDDLATSVTFHRTLLRIRRLGGRYVLLLGKGDYMLDGTIDALLPANVARVWGNNLAANTNRLRYFPMGRDFRSLAEIKTTAPKLQKNTLCYANFSLNTHPVRPQILAAIRDKPFMLIEHMGNFLDYAKSRTDFMAQLADSKFAVCPRGNAIETFRMWDALSLGTIPIVVREASFHDELTDLPILFLDNAQDFGRLTAAQLEETYERFLDTPFNFAKLRLSYWLDRVYDDCLVDEV